MMKVNAARDAAPNTAPMATRANAPGERFAAGQILSTTMANTEPIAALAMNIGASSPPEVPDPSEMTSAADLKIITESSVPSSSLAFRMSEMVSYPTPSTRGTKYPMMPSPSAPIAGHHMSWMGSFSNWSSTQ